MYKRNKISLSGRKYHQQSSTEATLGHVFGLKGSLALRLMPMLFLLFMCSTASAESELCPVAYTYYEGQHISLTANPAGTEYSYEWTAPGIVPDGGTDPWVFEFDAPSVSASTDYTITVILGPMGAVDDCKDRCVITVTVLERASLGDFVWEDLNGDGIQDDGEPGIEGVTVELLDDAGSPVTDSNGIPITTQTDANGFYHFYNLIPDTYIVKFNKPPGYYFSPWETGTDDKDSDVFDVALGTTIPITLTAGEINNNMDAGLIRHASLGNFVWWDEDEDGIQDAGESGVNYVTVQLLDSSGNVIDTTYTDANGLYSFTNIEPGDYKIKFFLPACSFFTKIDEGSNDAEDSDADTVSGETTITTLISGEIDETWDAGLIAYDRKDCPRQDCGQDRGYCW